MWTHENVSMCVNTPIMQLAQLNAFVFIAAEIFQSIFGKQMRKTKKQTNTKRAEFKSFISLPRQWGCRRYVVRTTSTMKTIKEKKNFEIHSVPSIFCRKIVGDRDSRSNTLISKTLDIKRLKREEKRGSELKRSESIVERRGRPLCLDEWRWEPVSRW